MGVRLKTLRQCVRFMAVVTSGAFLACRPAPSAEKAEPPPTAARTTAIGSATEASKVEHVDAGFRSRQLMEEHFAKHGAEFGEIAADEYLRRAQELRDAPLGGAILEVRRADGTASRFDRESGAFVAFDADGTIRTFFRPNDGEAYFQRQARRRGMADDRDG
ncbi:MAG: hypothetical protein MNPFHGCM_01870 [Gemmatimonadaceae bacterium]|nr:hypothetical protein [Gemmatimonadaceae bacterium]